MFQTLKLLLWFNCVVSVVTVLWNLHCNIFLLWETVSLVGLGSFYISIFILEIQEAIILFLTDDLFLLLCILQRNRFNFQV